MDRQFQQSLRYAAIERSSMNSKIPKFSAPAAMPWKIIALLFVVALINYFDRQSLSVVAPRIQADLHLGDRGYAHVVSLFLLASAGAYAISGFITDWLGTRRAMALFVGWWSLAEAATSFVTTGTQLGIVRFCLGLGEPGLWVAAPKAMSEVVPKERRSLAIGIYTSGATVGAVIALPVIVYVITRLPYRSIFLIDGLAGLLWLPVWWLCYRFERKTVTAIPAIRSQGSSGLRTLLANSATWRLLFARALTDPVWYFYLFWFPKYLLNARGLSLVQVAHIGWLVYLGAGVGTIVAGSVSGMLMRHGISALHAYRWTMLGAALIVPVSPLAAIISSSAMCVLIASIVAFAHMSWLVTLTAVIIEIYPNAQVGRAAGLIAAGSGFGGMVSSEIVGWLVTHGGYTQVFWIMAFLHPIAIILLWRVYGRRPADSSLVSIQAT
jgi:ACS family hexuronate transporter-like MFS transporter